MNHPHCCDGQAPNIDDIPNQLRALADRITYGRFGQVEAALVILPRLGGYPVIFSWGSEDGEYNPANQMELGMKAYLQAALRQTSKD